MRQFVIMQEHPEKGLVKITPGMPINSHPAIAWAMEAMRNEFVDSVAVVTEHGKTWLVAIDLPAKSDMAFDVMPPPNDPINQKAVLDAAWRKVDAK